LGIFIGAPRKGFNMAQIIFEVSETGLKKSPRSIQIALGDHRKDDIIQGYKKNDQTHKE
jgi:hypothetical protein